MKKIVEQLYDTCTSSLSTKEIDAKVMIFIPLLLAELVRPNDFKFRKVRMLLFHLNNHCKKVYHEKQPLDWILMRGPINMLLLYLIRCLETPFSVGAKPTHGAFARPVIARISEIFMFYSSDIRPDKFQAKDDEFKNLFNDVLKKFDSQLKSISSFYLELLNVKEEEILEDVGESDSFYFSDELAFVGQHIVAVGSEKLKEPSKDIEDIEGEKLLKLFLADNPSLQDLKIPIPELAFPAFNIPVNNNTNSDDKSTSSFSSKSKKSSSTSNTAGRKDSKAKK